MALPEQGWLQLGQTVLRWAGVAPRAAAVVDLAPARSRLEAWIAAGGLLGVQGLHPLANLPRARRTSYSVLAAGDGAALPALAGVAYGFQHVAAVLPREDHEAFLASVAAMRSGGEIRAVERMEDVGPDPVFLRGMFGCGGSAPDLAACTPLVRRLRPEGQLVLFALPAAATETAFRDLAHRGMHLRGGGSSGGLAYLAGSLENPADFLP